MYPPEVKNGATNSTEDEVGLQFPYGQQLGSKSHWDSLLSTRDWDRRVSCVLKTFGCKGLKVNRGKGAFAQTGNSQDELFQHGSA